MLFQNNRGRPPFVGDGPQVYGLHGSAVFQVARAAVSESEVRATGVAAPVHVVGDDVAVVADDFFIASFLVEIHVDVAGIFGFFAEDYSLAREGDEGEFHAVGIAPLHYASVILGRQGFFPEIVETIDEIAAVLHERVARALEDFRVLIVWEHGVNPGIRVAPAPPREFVVVIAGIHGGGEGDLSDVVQALGRVGFSFGASERGQEHGSENADDANDNQQFNEREGAVGSVFHFAFHLIISTATSVPVYGQYAREFVFVTKKSGRARLRWGLGGIDLADGLAEIGFEVLVGGEVRREVGVEVQEGGYGGGHVGAAVLEGVKGEHADEFVGVGQGAKHDGESDILGVMMLAEIKKGSSPRARIGV
jgi:hypothetical protein